VLLGHAAQPSERLIQGNAMTFDKDALRLFDHGAHPS